MNKFSIARNNENFFCTFTYLGTNIYLEPGIFVGHLAHYLFPIWAILSTTLLGKLICSNGSSGGVEESSLSGRGGTVPPPPH